MNKACRGLAIGLCLALAAGLAGCAPSTVTVTGNDAGTIQSARVGDRVVVRLEGNPTTGFTWARTAPADEAMAGAALEPVEEGEWQFPAGADIPGAPGVCVFEYEVVRSGTVTLEYAYARSWEGELAETFSVTIWARD